MRYPGGKGQPGIYQRIINLMPPHDLYIETHVGGGNILERKRPARASIVIDADPRICDLWRGVAASGAMPGLTVIEGDAAGFLRSRAWTGHELVYCDPPYVLSTRRSGRRYRHEYTDGQHAELLALLVTLPAHVMVSGYRCDLYDTALLGWYRVDFPYWTRGHTWAMESLWCNFDPPAALHDYRYIGRNFRERERIKRKRARWRARLEKLPTHERAAMLAMLLDIASSESAMSADLAENGEGARRFIVKKGVAGSGGDSLVGTGDGDLLAISNGADAGIAGTVAA